MDELFSMERMHAVWLVLFQAAGLAALVFGGGLLCKGAVGVALFFKLRPVVVGLTVVALATSTPELFTSLVAAYSGNTGLVLGNVVGSNIANAGLILGLAALVCPLVVKLRLIRRDVPITIGATFLFCALAWNTLGRGDGVVLLLFCCAYFVWLVRWSSTGDEAALEDDVTSVIADGAQLGWRRSALLILAGTVLLALGAEFLVDAAVETAARLGVNEVLVGVTIVAIGTSLPELAASLSAAIMRQTDICAGNIIGSNLFNLVLIGGAAAVVRPIPVEPRIFAVEIPALLLFTLLLWPFFMTGRVVSRREGTVLLGLYGLFLTLTFLSQTGALGF